jgi:hypothetical protein
VTTFRGVTLSQYATLKQSLRSSIPIVDTASVSDSPYLHLENQRRLRKQSYVRLDNVYETNISNLRSYSDIEFPAYHWRLDENSYHKLMGLLFLKVQDYPPTDSLRSIKKIRNARITISAPGRTATQDPENVYIPHRASQETVPRLPGHSIQTYETHHSPPYIGYDSIVQLPPPTPYRTQRRQNSTSCSISSIIIFFVCLLWLFFFYAVWRAWQKFFGS